MNKTFLQFLMLLILNSCVSSNFIFQNKTQTIGLDFTKGQWLINDIDCPSSVYNELTDLSLKKFKFFLNDRLFPVYSVKGIILPKIIYSNPNKNFLKEIKKGCKEFDYLINIKAGNLKQDFNGLDITRVNNINRINTRTNQNEVLIEVYDLNQAEIIYSQKVIGSTTSAKDNQDIHFSKTSRSLILGAYRKIMNDIEKKSIKKTN